MNAALFDDGHTGATFSPCRRWRYLLWRIWNQQKPAANFLMLNPSTADERDTDNTITRSVNFARDWGYGSLKVTNLFAWRATWPDEMKKLGGSAVGPENDFHILRAARSAGIVVCAWGNDGAWLDRDQHVIAMLLGAGIKPHCLKINEKTGKPAHPLYLDKTLVPVQFLGKHLPDDIQ